MKLLRLLLYYVRVPMTWSALTLHNTWGILNVLDIIWLRPMRGGMIDEAHPFCTGIDPETGGPIWPSNILFRSKRPDPWVGNIPPDSDEEIVLKIGHHLRKQV